MEAVFLQRQRRKQKVELKKQLRREVIANRFAVERFYCNYKILKSHISD